MTHMVIIMKSRLFLGLLALSSISAYSQSPACPLPSGEVDYLDSRNEESPWVAPAERVEAKSRVRAADDCKSVMLWMYSPQFGESRVPSIDECTAEAKPKGLAECISFEIVDRNAIAKPGAYAYLLRGALVTYQGRTFRAFYPVPNGKVIATTQVNPK